MIYWKLALGGLIGFLLHNSLKIISIKRSMRKKGVKVSVREIVCEYVTNEADTLFLAIVFFIALLFITSEVYDLKDVDIIDYTIALNTRLKSFRFSDWVKFYAIGAGFISSSMSYFIVGTADDYIRTKVEAFLKRKADDADLR